ncbi:MAG: FtsW/RodA/SpoVE family cell cycle protein [Minisyncoccia bacterium]
MKDNFIRRFWTRIHVDWRLFAPAFLISLAGLVTMNSFSDDGGFFSRQSLWLFLSVIVFFATTAIDWHFLRRTKVLVSIFLATLFILVLLLVAAESVRGVESWFQFGSFAVQPSELAKLVLVLILAKYFSRRHIEIKNIRHIIVSGTYALVFFIPVFFQPDFGGAMVIFGIWFGMVLISGISKKHLGLVVFLALATFAFLWTAVFAPYQKERIISFLNPLADIQGTGYNAYQSTIAVGSGELFGKGVGQGSQSKLRFLPEYQTDFIFAAFTEEWGFFGAILLFALVLFLLLRIMANAETAASNFESFVGLGVVIWLFFHIAVHTGMNMGVLPVTGITFPFMSYGGSHLLVEWFALGILSSMGRRSQGPRL